MIYLSIISSHAHIAHMNTSSFPSLLNNSAFCVSSDKYSDRNYPIDLPESHIPWIWDAIYDPIKKIVELTTMNRAPCKFDKTQWLRMVELFPNHSHQLAYGLETNILVSYDENATADQENYLHNSVVFCEYFRDKVLIYTATSLRIRGKTEYTAIGTLQIRCPTPLHYNWDSIRLRLDPKRQEFLNVYEDVTAIVPVCNLPKYKIHKKQYKLSVCTATGRANREQLVEWIEYNMLIGVEHFYIYDTSLPHSKSNINVILNDYITENKVTVVPWPFMNCVRYMANGRWGTWFENNVKYDFKAPRAIAQSAALASCYVRFKHTSKYMAHIDDDEFMTFSSANIQSLTNSAKSPTSLSELSDILFRRFPKSAAIRFEPITFFPCNVSKGIELMINNTFNYSHLNLVNDIQHYQSTPLPRLGVWDLSEPFDKFECKMIMRTDAVGMFAVHFISLLEFGPWRSPKKSTKPDITLPLNALALLHYKYPYQLANVVLEGLQPIKADSFKWECVYEANLGWAKKLYYPQIPIEIGKKLKQNYIVRLNGLL